MSNKAYKIYSGDYSKEGYDQGIDDRKEKKPKNKFKFFKAVHHIPPQKSKKTLTRSHFLSGNAYES